MSFTPVPTVIDGEDLTDDFTLAVKDAADELQKLKSDGETAPDDGTATVGTTPKVVDSITLPDQGPGRLHVWWDGTLSKTVATDRFGMTLGVNGGAVFYTSVAPNPGSETLEPRQLSGSVAVTGATTVDVTVTRGSGTGTATVSGGSQCSMHYIFVPAP